MLENKWETTVFSFTALSHYFFSKSQLALNRKFLDLIDYLKCTFIHLLTRLYLMPFQKTSRVKGNNRPDRQYIWQLFGVIIDISVGVNYWEVMLGFIRELFKVAFDISVTPLFLTSYFTKTEKQRCTKNRVIENVNHFREAN